MDYINLLYRILHDVSESPRAAFGGTERDLSGVALEIELQPLLQKVQRKRLIRTSVYQRRGELILRLLEKYRGERFGDVRLRVLWSPVLPRDMARLVANEQTLVQAGMRSRRQAMTEIGVGNPEYEFKRWLEEREAILKMNQVFKTRATRGGRERAEGLPVAGVEE
ncbi:MAG: phage portal protein [Chloroflexota bacterium]